MNLVVPSRNQIAAQIDAILGHDVDARCIAIRSPQPGGWPDSVKVRDRLFRLLWCDSQLVARQALVESENPETDGIVLLTNLGERDFGADVIARLSRGRVFQLETWDMVRRLFQAIEIDSRLATMGWIAELLLESAPAEGYPPVPGGFLDLDTAWNHALASSIGLAGGRPDAFAILRWSMKPDGTERFRALGDSARSSIGDWLESCAGVVGRLVILSVESGNGLDALPLGLVCGVAFAETEMQSAELAEAGVRLERFVGGRRIRADEGRRWAEAAARVVRSVEPQDVRPFLERADRLLRELHLSKHASLSTVLPSGLEARLASFATGVSELLVQISPERLENVERAAAYALAHDLAEASGTRAERARMALRLARWLSAKRQMASDFSGLTRSYAEQEAFVDWARLKLLGGDELAALSAAYAALSDLVRERREEINRRFAEALKAWNAAVVPVAECVPLERVLDDVVSPLARNTRLLLLVVDGLSFPIFRELCADLEKSGWCEIVPAQGLASLVGIATFPTITELSRASLLSGKLVRGGASVEKSGFANHAGLLGASKASAKPVVFHKGELDDGLGLSRDVRAAVGGDERRIVAVVYNAVDDHLSGSDQLHLRWSLDDLRLLKPLLHEARAGGRALVITADHGHVIDEKSVLRASSPGDRWRDPTGAAGDGEIILEGGRVRSPSGSNGIVCAWSEKLRYSAKKNGYHGGVSPQEVIVPLNVFLPASGEIEGWKAAVPIEPEWWQDKVRATVGAKLPSAVPEAKPRKPKSGQQPELFQDLELPSAADWIATLIATGTYQQQRQLAARVAPSDEEMRGLLEALSARGGKLSKTALAQRLEMPLLRVSGFVNAARRVLNVDQSAVLSVDEQGGYVELNRELLEVQFQLPRR